MHRKVTSHEASRTAPIRARRDSGETLTRAPRCERLACSVVSMLHAVDIAISMLIARIAKWYRAMVSACLMPGTGLVNVSIFTSASRAIHAVSANFPGSSAAACRTASAMIEERSLYCSTMVPSVISDHACPSEPPDFTCAISAAAACERVRVSWPESCADT